MTAAFCRSSGSFSGRVTQPPPVAITQPERLPSSASRAVSSARKAASPSRAKNVGISQPKRRSSSSSASKKSRPSRCASRRPTVVFPAPGIPMRMRLRMRFCSASVMTAVHAGSMGRCKNSSAAQRACSASMERPFSARRPSRSACCSRAVRAGLYTRSSTHRHCGTRRRSSGETPFSGYMPTGVALTTSRASACCSIMS